jgi:GAF domain-containing protein
MLALLFERLQNLEHAVDALAGARFCLEAVAFVLPCRASLVHLFDLTRKEFLVVDARGTQASTMKLARHGIGDPLLRMAMPTGRPFAWHDLRYAPVNRLARFKAIDSVRTILACPVTSGQGWLGAIELVDPLGGGAFKTEHENAMRYVCDRYAKFLGSRGVITDVATVARFAFGEKG